MDAADQKYLDVVVEAGRRRQPADIERANLCCDHRWGCRCYDCDSISLFYAIGRVLLEDLLAGPSARTRVGGQRPQGSADGHPDRNGRAADAADR